MGSRGRFKRSWEGTRAGSQVRCPPLQFFFAAGTGRRKRRRIGPAGMHGCKLRFLDLSSQEGSLKRTP